ncbi:MAG: glycosyltransferase family 2 protein [Microgenomates group bacterium]
MKLSVALAIFNEESTITRCIESVYDIADEIIVIDGGSTDETLAILKKLDEGSRTKSGMTKIKVFHEENPPMFHINKQKALEKCTGDWILQLDADEVVSAELAKEISSILSGTSVPLAFWIPRLNYFLGKPLRKGGQYPDPTIRLYKNGVAHFPCKTVHEQVAINGEVGWLKNDLLHYPYETFSSYIHKWTRYSMLEAEENFKKGIRPSFWNACKYGIMYPSVWFLKTYFRHRGYVDGFAGFIFSLFSSLRYWIEYIRLYEIKNSSH